jgi:hypothetical protein
MTHDEELGRRALPVVDRFVRANVRKINPAKSRTSVDHRLSNHLGGLVRAIDVRNVVATEWATDGWIFR